MKTKIKFAIVTGGAGFIGCNMTLRLLKDGWTVYVVDNMSSGIELHVKEIEEAGATFYKCSYGSTIAANLIDDVKPDVVFHFGAIPRVVYSIENPTETNNNNVQETLKLLEACKGNVGRFIFSSSRSVNGDTDVMPTPTTLNRRPKSPYALQKATIEDYCRLWSELYELDTVSLRYFNVFGPRQYGASAYNTVISAWCNNIAKGKNLRLDGTGEQSRDFCYIDNVVEANLLAAACTKKFSGDVFNIAGGETHTVREVLTCFHDRCGHKIGGDQPRKFTVVQASPRVGDVFATQADLTESKEVFGYEPIVNFEEGLRRTFEWWKL